MPMEIDTSRPYYDEHLGGWYFVHSDGTKRGPFETRDACAWEWAGDVPPTDPDDDEQARIVAALPVVEAMEQGVADLRDIFGEVAEVAEFRRAVASLRRWLEW